MVFHLPLLDFSNFLVYVPRECEELASEFVGGSSRLEVIVPPLKPLDGLVIPLLGVGSFGLVGKK